MKKYLQNDKGYSLLLAIGAILIFTVLGLSLITLTTNGIAKNSHREDTILAQDLSDKGIDFAVNDIQNTLEKQIIATPMGKTEFGTFLDTTLNKTNLKCPAAGQPLPANIGFHIPTENNNITKVCIEAVKMITNSSGITEEKDKYKRLVTFRSYGVVKKKEHISKTDVIIGTDAIPDQLRYAVSTNNGGNLFLHGGVEVQGDIKTDGNLIISNYASWGTATSNINRWTASVFPRIVKNVNSVNPKIITSENKDIYYFKLNSNNDSTNFYYKHEAGTELSKIQHYDKLSFKENAINPFLFNTTNISLVRKKLEDDKLDIPKEFSKISSSATTYMELTNTPSNNNKNKVYYIKQETYCSAYSRWSGKCIEYSMSSGSINLTGSTNNKANMNLVGTYYVEGNVDIDYTNLKADAILYVKGNVSINQSTLKGVNTDSTLFIFAEGDITFSNMHDPSSSPTDNINEVKGFFYSKSNMMLLGVKSYMKFIGGVSGKRVILTGVRGIGKDNIFNDVHTQKNKSARLQIIYDENLIKMFHEFKRDEKEEYVTQLNEPETIKRY
ncbi:hypothetical protein [Lysinibacillus sp. 3P01SB]|uniref:hypothetical protein n=1 Tax=Lysinibacillus sp. 3P01SB TaxID=3132284 RepID=UPI0039A75A7E